MLRITGVSKQFGRRRAVDNLTLEVPEGHIFGLLGPNGAGKTTLLRMVMGLIKPSAGSITLLDNLQPGSEAALRQIGYMPQRLALYPGLTARENLRFFAELYGLSSDAADSAATRMLELVELSERGETPSEQLSGGMRRRLLLASVLVHQPKLVILDEPTAGVDPVLRLELWNWFERLVEQGTSIVITTHHIFEATRCGRVVFLREGRLLADDTPQALIQKYGASDLEDAFVRATQEPS